jgi:transposase
MSYSDDLRHAVVHAVHTPRQSQASVARLLGLSLSTVKRVVHRFRATGSSQQLPHGGGQRPKLNTELQEALRQYVAAHPAALLCELTAWLEREHQVKLSLSALSRRLRRMELPRKKERGTPRNATRRSTASGDSGVPG